MTSALLVLVCLKQRALQQAELIKQITESGRCVTLAESPDQRVDITASISPGRPPMLSFRYYEGKLHHRFGNDDLMLDDAGH